MTGNITDKTRGRMFFLSSLVVMAALLLIGAALYLNGALQHALVLAGFSGALFLTVLYYKVFRNYSVVGNVFVVLMGLFCTYLLLSGGETDTRVLWVTISPVLVLFLFGVRRGSIGVGIILAVTVVVMVIPEYVGLDVRYSRQFSFRFVGALLGISCLATLYELSRERMSDRIESLERSAAEQSYRDALTGIPNRKDMMERLEQITVQSRKKRTPFSVVIGNVDYFKNINDKYGFEFGDYVLKEISHSLQSILRPQDIVARWDGVEFLVLLPDTNEKGAAVIGEKIRQAVEELSLRFGGNFVSVTMSLGVKTATDTESIADVLRFADEHMYIAKQKGRNNVVFDDPTHSA